MIKILKEIKTHEELGKFIESSEFKQLNESDKRECVNRYSEMLSKEYPKKHIPNLHNKKDMEEFFNREDIKEFLDL